MKTISLVLKSLVEKLEQENSELQGMLKNIPDEIIEEYSYGDDEYEYDCYDYDSDEVDYNKGYQWHTKY